MVSDDLSSPTGASRAAPIFKGNPGGALASSRPDARSVVLQGRRIVAGTDLCFMTEGFKSLREKTGAGECDILVWGGTVAGSACQISGQDEMLWASDVGERVRG